MFVRPFTDIQEGGTWLRRHGVTCPDDEIRDPKMNIVYDIRIIAGVRISLEIFFNFLPHTNCSTGECRTQTVPAMKPRETSKRGMATQRR